MSEMNWFTREILGPIESVAPKDTSDEQAFQKLVREIEASAAISKLDPTSVKAADKGLLKQFPSHAEPVPGGDLMKSSHRTASLRGFLERRMAEGESAEQIIADVMKTSPSTAALLRTVAAEL